MHRGVHSLILVSLLLVAGPSGAEEPDVLTLEGGNRVTGTVRELSRGVLTFSIEGAGRVDIDWRNVLTLHSSQQMDVELASGRRLLGALASPEERILEVRTTAGAERFPMDEVVRVTPIRATFRERSTGSADIGFDFLSAGDELDLTLNADFGNRTKNYQTSATLSALVRRRDGETIQQRDRFEIDVRRFQQNRWFVLGQFEAEDNRELDLDLRLLAGAALGRTLHQSQRTLIALYAGLDLILEEYRNIPGSDTSPEALVSFEWDWFEVEGRTALDLKATTYRNLERSRWRLALDSSLRRYIVRDFYWALNLYESYDSEPPPGREHSDFGVSLTFGTDF